MNFQAKIGPFQSEHSLARMVGSEQGGLEAETAWQDAAKSRLPSEPRWKGTKPDLPAVASDQLPSSELASTT